MQSETKNCQNCKQNFTIDPEDFSFYDKIKVPPPTFCPKCRMQRRMAIRNERIFYRDECDMCRKSIFSMYSPDKPFKVFCRECWWSDKWDPLDFGAEYDFKKPFFTQYRALLERVPRIDLVHYHTCINARYANFVGDSKNVYLSYSVIKDSEDIYYSWAVDNSRNCFDSFNINKCEMCFQNTDCSSNYKSSFCIRSRECIDSSFLFDCVNCQDCFMSANLRNRRYVIRNIQYEKDTYEKEIFKINFGSFEKLEQLKKEFKIVVTKSVHKFSNITKSENCIGDNIENSKNTQNAFTATKTEDCKHSFRVVGVKGAYDITGSAESELIYECVAGGNNSYMARFSAFNDTTIESFYSDWCHGSSNMFGCISARKKEYCILNKQYSKEEYELMIPKIIKQMDDFPYKDKCGRVYRFGEFFPIEISPFAHNETMAQEYFPLTKEEALIQGYSWRDPDARNYTVTKFTKDLLDDIESVDDSILEEVIGCEHAGNCLEQCTTAFRVHPNELMFYRSMKLPLPTLCPNCRHYERLKQKNPLKLWHRKCMKEGCSNEFETSYAPERPEIIYCERCYQNEVY